MLVPILTDYYKKGYIPPLRYNTLFAHFPNCNLSIRRETLQKLGFYNEGLSAFWSDDLDLCRRVMLGGWELFYEPRAGCYHEARRSIWGLIKQWVIYGYSSAFVYKKQQKERFEIFVSLAPQPKVDTYFRLFRLRRFPIKVLIFSSRFLIAHLLLLSFLLGILMQLPSVSLVAGFLLGGIFVRDLYLKNLTIRRLNILKMLRYGYITYIINVSCLLGSIVGGFKNRMIYLHSGI